MDNNPSSSTKFLRKTMIVLGAIFLVIILGVVAFIFMFSWEGSTKDIETAANKFSPPSGWTETNRSLRGPRVVCLDGGSCPQANITWQTSQPIDRIKFMNSLKAAGWDNLQLSKTCDPSRQDTPDTLQSCLINTVSGSYGILISIDSGGLSTTPTNMTTISLSLRPDGR